MFTPLLQKFSFYIFLLIQDLLKIFLGRVIFAYLHIVRHLLISNLRKVSKKWTCAMEKVKIFQHFFYFKYSHLTFVWQLTIISFFGGMLLKYYLCAKIFFFSLFFFSFHFYFFRSHLPTHPRASGKKNILTCAS